MESLDHNELNLKNLAKSRDWVFNDRIALKFDSHLGSTAVNVPIKFQIDCIDPNQNLAASGLHEILQ